MSNFSSKLELISLIKGHFGLIIKMTIKFFIMLSLNKFEFKNC